MEGGESRGQPGDHIVSQVYNETSDAGEWRRGAELHVCYFGGEVVQGLSVVVDFYRLRLADSWCPMSHQRVAFFAIVDGSRETFVIAIAEDGVERGGSNVQLMAWYCGAAK